MKVVLLGYMGSGKSSLGRAFSEIISTEFIDLDDYISEKEGMSISELFENKGEIYFRKKENTYLNQLLNKDKDVVIALGGGTPCYGNNMQRVKNSKNTRSIYLNGSVKTLSERLLLDKDKRPLLSNIDDLEQMQEFIGKHLFERNPFYHLADVKISIDGKKEKDILETLVLTLV